MTNGGTPHTDETKKQDREKEAAAAQQQAAGKGKEARETSRGK